MEKINHPKIDIVRHGQAKYGQEKVSLAEAQDLTPEGEEQVRASAEALTELIGPDEEVVIWSSPIGRTLQTAKIIAETLEQKGIHLRDKAKSDRPGIQTHEQLIEVKDFSWQLFKPLIEGGDLTFAGHKFFIDKKLSNPNNLAYPEYFTEDCISKISPEAKTQWPVEYVQIIDGMEKFIEVTRRMMGTLDRLKKLQDKPYRIIIVTHDALMGFIANIFSAGEKSGVDSGEFINLEIKDDKLVATRVGTITEGDYNTDIIEEFNQRHGQKN
ncbi:MAG: histidine phosphatase family protein [Patescibacteria group bacterium]